MTDNQNDPVGASESQGDGSEKQEFQFPGAQYAKSLFDRHQVASSDRSRLVNKVLQLAYSASHRRVKGQFDWTFGELEAVARHFGENLDEALIAASTTSAVPALFVTGDSQLPCHLWMGKALGPAAKAAVAAVNDGTAWLVGPVALLPDRPRFEVKRVLVEPNEPRARIAVLDDQPAITDALCQFLSASGFMADAFHSIEALQDALVAESYDAYVLDWVVGNDTVRALVEQLRNSGVESPIAILTGKANERGEVVTDIANLVATHDVRYFSKPLDPHMITAVLSRLIRRN